MEGTAMVISALGTISKVLGKGLEKWEIIVKISQNTEKSSGGFFYNLDSSKRPSADVGVIYSHILN